MITYPNRVFIFSMIFNLFLMLTGCSLFPFVSDNQTGESEQTDSSSASHEHSSIDSESDRASRLEQNERLIPIDGTPGELKDLINNDHLGTPLDEEMVRRGYKKIHTDVAEHDVWTYWKKNSTLECIVIHINQKQIITSILRNLEDC